MVIASYNLYVPTHNSHKRKLDNGGFCGRRRVILYSPLYATRNYII